MATTIVQKVIFKNTTTKILYDLYMDAKKHAMIAAGPAVISAKEGSNYSVHGGYIKGKILKLVRNKLIVQTWRVQNWEKTETDSVFIIDFEQKEKDVVMHATHANVPDQHAAHIGKGWHDHYWNPWKQFIAGKPITRPQM